MKIRKAVIPAAGFGTRFLPFTKAVPKEMIPLVDKPVIQYVIEEAVDAGITDILIVTSAGKTAMQEHFIPNGDLYARLAEKGRTELLESLEKIDSLARIHYTFQQELKGLGHAVMQGEEFVSGEPFAILLGDTVTDSFTKQLVSAAEKTSASVTALEAVPREKTNRYGVIDGIDEGGGLHRVKTFVEKPEPEEAPSNLAIASRYVFTPEIFSFLRAAKPGKGGEIQLTDAMKAMAGEYAMYGLEVSGHRYDIGNKLDFVKSTLEFALKRPEFRDKLIPWLKDIFAGI